MGFWEWLINNWQPILTFLGVILGFVAVCVAIRSIIIALSIHRTQTYFSTITFILSKPETLWPLEHFLSGRLISQMPKHDIEGFKKGMMWWDIIAKCYLKGHIDSKLFQLTLKEKFEVICMEFGKSLQEDSLDNKQLKDLYSDFIKVAMSKPYVTKDMKEMYK
ncbi:MAG TPA: hypothetical protein PLP35_09160 [Caldisericia bacterium]|nr:hypothetical protein [Caldisericia bacterium]HRV75669.1 hypothetical protein [Caldisericia bacterium]